MIADYRIRNPDITPALGRGYSLTTYDVLSTCLAFEEKTQPTYNYDYEMLEFTHAGAQESSGSASLQASVSWPFIKGTISASVSHATTDTRKSHFVSTRMATERYYSSINEQTATLMPSALALIQRGDLVSPPRPHCTPAPSHPLAPCTAPRPIAPSRPNAPSPHCPPPSRSQVGFFQVSPPRPPLRPTAPSPHCTPTPTAPSPQRCLASPAHLPLARRRAALGTSVRSVARPSSPRSSSTPRLTLTLILLPDPNPNPTNPNPNPTNPLLALALP